MPLSGNLSFLPPDVALEDRRIARRQRIADLLIQQGLEPVENRQHGRFYVAPSPWQYAAQGAKAMAGGYLSKQNDDASKEMVARYQQLLADEVQEKIDQLHSGIPASPAVPGQAGNLQDLIAAMPGRTLDASMPDVRPTGHPPMLDTRVPSTPQLRRNIAAWTNPNVSSPSAGVLQNRMANLQGPDADLTTSITPQAAASGSALILPTPDQPAQPATGGHDPSTRQRIIQELMLSRYNPQARALGQMLATQAFQEQERTSREAFQEKELGVRREAIASQAMTRMEMIRNTAALTQMQIESREQLGRDASDLKKQLAEQTNELKRLEIQTRRDILGVAKTPAGYRQTPEGNLQAIPGGPADTKLQGALNQDTQTLTSMVNSLDRLGAAANEVLRHPGLGGITGMKGAFPNIPGGQAANAQAKLDTLKSQIGFSVLQEMRNNSKTGGALGQVSDFENKQLQNALDSLQNSQSIEQMQDSLKNIVSYTEAAKDRMRAAYNMKHGEAQTGGKKADTLPATPGLSPAPATNAKGWKLMMDANGNKAYVSPDGTQFEEVK